MVLFARVTGENVELDFSGTVVNINHLDTYHGVAARWHNARAEQQAKRCYELSN